MPLLISLSFLFSTSMAGGAKPGITLFQLSDTKKSQVDANRMCTESFGTYTNRLLLAGYGSIYRSRDEDHVFIFYATGYGLFGEVYRVEQFDLKGNLVRKGEFRCNDLDVPVTLLRLTGTKNGMDFEYGVGVIDQEDPLYGGELIDIAYLTYDGLPDQDYRKEFELNGRIMVKALPIVFFNEEGEPEGPTSLNNNTDHVFVESLDAEIPFLRFDLMYDVDGNRKPPYKPDKPKELKESGTTDQSESKPKKENPE